MIKIIDLELVKSYLRIDFDDDDELLQLFIQNAYNELLMRTGQTSFNLGSTTLAKIAMLKMVSFNYKHRDSIIDKKSFIIPRYLDRDLELLKYGGSSDLNGII